MAEINDKGVSDVIDHEVRKTEVAVEDASRMYCSQSPQERFAVTVKIDESLCL